MNEHPILFTGDMVRAILDDRKTQTRRIIKKIPSFYDLAAKLKSYGEEDYAFLDMADPIGTYPTLATCPYGKVGDTLWVREAWWDLGFYSKGKWFGRTQADIVGPEYVADGEPEGPMAQAKRPSLVCKWRKRPSIHMPKWACRIFLEITNIRVERVQEITPEDCVSEGIDLIQGKRGLAANTAYRDYSGQGKYCGAMDSFRTLWDSINAKRAPWKDNPWV